MSDSESISSSDSSDSENSLNWRPVSDSSDSEGEFESDEEVQQLVGEKIEFYEVKSQRVFSLLTREGFEYTFDKEVKAGESWKCVQRRPYCRGRILVDPQWHGDNPRHRLGIITQPQHIHPANEHKQEIR